MNLFYHHSVLSCSKIADTCTCKWMKSQRNMLYNYKNTCTVTTICYLIVRFLYGGGGGDGPEGNKNPLVSGAAVN